MDYKLLLLLFNSSAYIVTFFIYQRRLSSIQVGSVVLFLYSAVSIGSIYLYYSNPIWGIWDFTNITIFPFIYLYIILLISFMPLLVFTSDKVRAIRMPKASIMNWISVFIILVYFVFFFQTILSSFSIGDLFNADILSENHEDRGETMTVKGGFNLFGVLKNIFSDVLWIMFMYNWVNGRRLLALGLISAIIIAIFTSLAWGSRGALFSVIMQLPFALIIFRPLMTKRQKKQVAFTAFALFALIFAGFWALTYGRFGDNVNHALTDIILYYFSSNFLMFNNYALDPGGFRYGDRVFPLLRILLGLNTSGGYEERRLIFSKLKIDDSQFTFFVGDFCIDFGPYFTFIIILIVCMLLYRILKKMEYDLGDVLIGLLWYNVLSFGFTLFVYAEISGNIRILYLLFFIYLFKRFTPYYNKTNQ